MHEPKLTARTGNTLAIAARLSGSENHKGYDIIHKDGYVVAYVIPIDEDGAAGGELARQFAAAPDLYKALTECVDRIDTFYGPPGSNHIDRELIARALAALGKARGEKYKEKFEITKEEDNGY